MVQTYSWTTHVEASVGAASTTAVVTVTVERHFTFSDELPCGGVDDEVLPHVVGRLETADGGACAPVECGLCVGDHHAGDQCRGLRRAARSSAGTVPRPGCVP